MEPTLGHGKICYVIMAARDPRASAAFYSELFNWNIRERDSGELSFDDGVGEVSGMWIAGGSPVDASFLYIMVDDMARTCAAIPAAGGEIVDPPDLTAKEVTATFRDPAGNTFGLYQHRASPS